MFTIFESNSTILNSLRLKRYQVDTVLLYNFLLRSIYIYNVVQNIILRYALRCIRQWSYLSYFNHSTIFAKNRKHGYRWLQWQLNVLRVYTLFRTYVEVRVPVGMALDEGNFFFFILLLSFSPTRSPFAKVHSIIRGTCTLMGPMRAPVGYARRWRPCLQPSRLEFQIFTLDAIDYRTGRSHDRFLL